MDIKIKVQPMKRSEIPSITTGTQASCMYEQFLPIIKEFAESDSECISLLSGEPIEEQTLKNIWNHVKLAVEKSGYTEIMKVTLRTKANNLYVVKVGE